MNPFAELKRFAEQLEQVAARWELPICVTVVDAHGLVVLLHRMPGAGVLSLEMAERKAYTSVVMGCESGALMSAVQPGQPGFTLTSSSSRLIAFGGGTRIQFGGEAFGIGISGGPTDVEDMDMLAEAQDGFGETSGVWAPRFR